MSKVYLQKLGFQKQGGKSSLQRKGVDCTLKQTQREMISISCSNCRNTFLHVCQSVCSSSSMRPRVDVRVDLLRTKQ